jgi:hypothetical protein
MKLHCHYCDADLEEWNTGAAFIKYCPACGRKLHKAVAEELWRLCTDDEIADMIEGQVLDMLDNCEDIDAGEIAYTAWESENADGVVFYSNYTADKFAIRHREWVDDALMSLVDRYGDDGRCAEMIVGCMDRFLVTAFIAATEHYLYSQLNIDNNEGRLSSKRMKEIRGLVKETRYDCQF